MGSSSSVIVPPSDLQAPQGLQIYESKSEETSITFRTTEGESTRSKSRCSSSALNWPLLDQLMKKNIRDKTRPSSGLKDRNGDVLSMNPTSFASKGISVVYLFKWWDQIKSSFPSCESLTTRELWKFLVDCHRGLLSASNSPFPSTVDSSESPYILYNDIPKEVKGFPDFVLAYNPDDSFAEIIKILKFHYYHHQEGEICHFHYIWIDFFLLNMYTLTENNNENIFYYSSCESVSNKTNQIDFEQQEQDAPSSAQLFQELQEKFGRQIENLILVHVCDSWNSIKFLQNFYSLLYLSYFMWNGVPSSGKISFLFSKQYAFQHQHILSLMKEWKPMKFDYYANGLSSEKNEQSSSMASSLRSNQSSMNGGLSIMTDLDFLENSLPAVAEGEFKFDNFHQEKNQQRLNERSESPMCQSIDSIGETTVESSFKRTSAKKTLSGSSFREFLLVSRKIMEIFDTWNTLKMFYLFYLLKYFNISPFFFKEIVPLSLQREHANECDSVEVAATLAGGKYGCESYETKLTPRMIEKNEKELKESQLFWEEMFTGSRMNWKQMAKTYNWFYYDYKILGNASNSSSVKMKEDKIEVFME